MWIRLKQKRIQEQFKKDLEEFLRQEAELTKLDEEQDLYDRVMEARQVWKKGGKEALIEYLKEIEEEPPLPKGIVRRG